MTRYNDHIVEPGQYPATAWTKYGLPAQNEDSGAPGSPPYSGAADTVDGAGHTNEPGQYPVPVMPFTGTALGFSGAPGSAGIKGGQVTSGPDSVHYTKDVPLKSQWTGDMTQGALEYDANGTVSGKGDWTQANVVGYQAPARYQMPGTAQISLDAGGSGAYQPGAGNVRVGGFLRGQR